MKTKCATHYAPGKRLSIQEVQSEFANLSEHLCSKYFDFFPLPLMVVNSHRQIVFSNQAFLNAFGVDTLSSFLAKRPGEAMGCVYSDKEEGGCGTSMNCRECGAVQAIMESILGKMQTEHDCQLLLKIGTDTAARDLRVFVSPWKAGRDTYYVVTLMDIEDEKRRRILERIFFHDILNSAGGASGLIDMLLDEVPQESKEVVGIVKASLFAMVEEIQKQKQLLSMERKEFTVSKMTLQGLEVVRAIAAEFLSHPKAIGKIIILDEKAVNVAVYADFALLRRVIVNMLMNALEATREGGCVTLGLKEEDEKAVFWVKNSTVMSESVKLQVFKRSFSTKGQDRGLGTYSIKLLTENYLGGEVGFSSDNSEGTTFWVKLEQSESIPARVSNAF
ncbi:sensor histidine kinase [Fundidesulfovibrio putealis]|uniref:sensor histidine kinase n=1 Tax=Fundidesulfovibrio putealis TaxID=270496 RepID=UPI00041F5AD2|nr:HAMP domain-containing sensor histidine kinase [Fundidesulfovibrio putealis]